MQVSRITENHKQGFIVFLYILVAVVASIQCFNGILRPEGAGGHVYTGYNNYVLFKNSFFHLIHGSDLYRAYPDEEWDLFKYSPTFAFCFGLMAYLPDFAGLVCWNLLNTLPLLLGIMQLREMTINNKIFALLFCALELMNSLQNSQSNGLMAGLLILTFTSLENRKYILACFLVVFSVYLKIYGGIGFFLFLFYPSKSRLLIFSLLWFLVLGALPLFFVHWDQLTYLYSSWGKLLKQDEYNSTGISVMGILGRWFPQGISKNQIILFGCLIFVFPFFQFWKYKMVHFRLLILSAMLIWVVIFNHKAESPTYIIAMAGIAIWFFSGEKSKLNILLVTLAFIFTTLASGDLMPAFIKNYLKYYHIKALFSTVIFVFIWIDLWRSQPRFVISPVL